jgi:hypothetical protein
VSGGRIHGIEIRDVQAVEEVLFDLADAVFDAAFFVAFADVAGHDIKTTVSGKICR